MDGGIAFAREFTGYSLPVIDFARDAVTARTRTSLQRGPEDRSGPLHARVTGPRMPKREWQPSARSERRVSRCVKEHPRHRRKPRHWRGDCQGPRTARFPGRRAVARGEDSSGRGCRCDVSNESPLRPRLQRVAARGPSWDSSTMQACIVQPKRPAECQGFRTYYADTEYDRGTSSPAARSIRTEGGRRRTHRQYRLVLRQAGVPENVAYCASKAAVGAITRCLAVEWAKDEIRVLDVAPGLYRDGSQREFLGKDKVKSWLRQPHSRRRRVAPRTRWRGSSASTCSPSDIAFLTGETIYVDGGQGIEPLEMRIFEITSHHRPWPAGRSARAGSGPALGRRPDRAACRALRPHGRVSLGKHPGASTNLALNAMFVPEAYGGAPMSYRAYLGCVTRSSPKPALRPASSRPPTSTP